MITGTDHELDRYSVPQAVWHERVKQDAKWGVRDHADPKWALILTEELGEVAECVLERDAADSPATAELYDELLDYEIVQIAAVAQAWLESRRRQRKGKA